MIFLKQWKVGQQLHVRVITMLTNKNNNGRREIKENKKQRCLVEVIEKQLRSQPSARESKKGKFKRDWLKAGSGESSKKERKKVNVPKSENELNSQTEIYKQNEADEKEKERASQQ